MRPTSDLFIAVNFRSLFKSLKDFSICDIGHGTCTAVFRSAELKYPHTSDARLGNAIFQFLKARRTVPESEISEPMHVSPVG